MSFADVAAPATDAVHAELYRLIAETIPQMVWVAQPDGSNDFFNSRLLEYAGMTAAALKGWGWRVIVHRQDWPPCLERWTRSLASGAPYEVEYRLRRADGAYRWHLGAARPLRDTTGRIVKWFGTCTDIDDQKRAAAVLEMQAAERALALQASEALAALRSDAGPPVQQAAGRGGDRGAPARDGESVDPARKSETL